MQELEGKIVVVTGSSRGIGATTAKLFANKGAKIVVNSRSNSQEGKKIMDEILAQGGEAIYIKADVSKYEDAARLIEETCEHFGKIDILINNAGVGVEPAFEELSDQDIQKSIADNLLSAIYCSQAAIKKMIQQESGGKVLNISSIRGWQWGGRAPIYAAAKAGINNLTTTLARMYSPKIMVNAVGPGFTKTPSYDGRSAEQIQGFLDQTLTKDWIQPEEIAEALLFLAESKSITGQVVYVDAGYMSRG